MHGARKASKWEELHEILDQKAVAIHSVAEVHLPSSEESPIRSNWHWTGCKKEVDCRGEGVGVLW